ncbi:PRA1 family protein A1-like [Coffea arabica]|uniref:PRA1 family protein n=1 Tax=Coffea arabica TaxID=13443 RepID=A0A6P6T3G5_COFAR|nr:PRA1 family protein A1-like [Coffea arabica]XP_027072527.1 PRA1 family protein A1-like [Coffea arabica]
MDWGNVTAEDLIEALREVDWSSPPRPPSEFFSRFTVPRSYSKWNSRLKCNLYYYRTNYFILITVILGLGFLRRPLAIVAALLTALSIAFLNDSFAGTFSEKITRTVRQFSPHLAAKMRPPLTPVIRGRPSAKRTIHICGRPRWVFVLVFSTVSFILWFVSCGLLTLLWAFAIGLLATVLHASFRTPNLKARLNTFREEFRAVWRNYSEL